VAAGVLGARAAVADGAAAWRGAVVPPLVHLSWGSGLLAGAARFLRIPEPAPQPHHVEVTGA
jgi:hypothetical protein